MVRTNFQEFVGDVHVLSNLQVGSNLFANDLAANVLTVNGSIGSTFFIGDGGLLSNIATTLNEIVANPGGNTVSNTLVFESGVDATTNTAILTYSNVGISISNTNPTGEYQLSIGSNIFVNTHASNVLTIVGAIGSDLFIGDGGLLSNIATTIDQIIDQGNTVSNTVIFESGIDATSNMGIVTKKDVGISVSNVNPTGEFQFGVGSNLLVNVYSSNVLVIEGNVNAQKMTLGTISVTSAYGLNHVTAQGSVTGNTISLTNATTGLTADSNIVAGGNVTAETLISTANIEVGDRLKFASNVFVDDLRVADLAANLVTYDKTTGELMDSGGLFANKLAVVSVQPPSALSANTTTIAKHGTYTVTTSSLAATSNAWNAFDGDSAVEWLGSTTSGHVYNGVEYTYSGTSNLFAGNYIQPGVSSAGEWLAIEFPYKTTLRHMKLTPPATYQQYPASANVYATNDSLTWTELTNWSGVNPGDQQSNVQTIVVNATESFKKYAMVVTKTNGSDTNTALAEWKLFTESFSIDGGKVAMAQQAATGGETVMDQSGPHGRGAAVLKKYPEIAFDGKIGNFASIPYKGDHNQTSNTYIIGGYEVVASSETTHDFSRMSAWKLFDSGLTEGEYSGWGPVDTFNAYNATNPGEYPTSGTARLATTDVDGNPIETGGWIYIKLPNKIKLKNYSLKPWGIANRFGVADYPKEFYIYASNDGTNWKLINSQTDAQTPSVLGSASSSQESISYDVNQTGLGYYSYYAMTIRRINNVAVQAIDGGVEATFCVIGDWKLYGYEEDPPAGDTSVDTTFTSIMNTPQTTGANVYVDGNLGETFTNRVTGPTVSNTHTTYVSAEKYWELSGNVESNVTVEANTFLEGDAPHSVSVWFNSSNLEANVSNSCIFSLATEEKLDSVNLDLQSNTWHNLTYAYQGEGGSRVTYLDGRKVAEDQAEDTFGDYPPFAMTGYSQGGYVVSASSDLSSLYPTWKAFDDSLATTYETWLSGAHYSGTPSTHDGSETTTYDGTSTVDGEWIQLELPHKIKLSYYSLKPQIEGENDTYNRRMPGTGKILGSNDGNNWYLIHDHSLALSDYTRGSYTNVYINTSTNTKAYKYIRFVIETIVGTDTVAGIGDMKLYGHRENDLVRLPDPTNVLKYPHIAMTGPAQRGYVVTTNNQLAESTAAWKAFDGNDGVHWQTANSSFGTSGDFSAVSGQTFAGYTGHWVKLELPYKLQLTRFKMKQFNHANQQPKDYVLLGSNNDSSWTLIHAETAANMPSGVNGGTEDVTSFSAGTPAAYKYIKLLVQKLEGSGGSSAGYMTIDEIEYYGTEEASQVPIQIGGGNIDKVANFRVYDKFIGEDQALEIWDAQKDTFRGVKNSMTLHKGRLGIGTTEPEGRLAVLDEPHNLEEFPPRAMTAEETYMEGHGVFKASVSSADNGLGIQNLFDKLGFSGKAADKYLEWGTSQYTSATGVYTGSVSTQGVSGEWLEIEMPYKIKLEHNLLYHRSRDGSLDNDYWVLERMPRDGAILGSNDGETWTTLQSWTNFDWVTGTSATGQRQSEYWRNPGKLVTNSTTYYKTFRLVFSKLFGANGDRVNLGEWRLFGTREQGQSVLHDGQLTLTKNLTVPRIGPALDADDTPRRDRLVVEYNTSTNPTFDGVVRDTSGRGNDGVFYGGASYDATEKALVFARSLSQYTERGIINASGDYTHSTSLWFKANKTTAVISTNEETLFHIGNQWAAAVNSYISFYGNRVYFAWNTYNINCATTDINQQQWNHICVTYTGGGSSLTTRKIYINGKVQTSLLDGTEGQLLNLPTNTYLTLGNIRGQSKYFDGSISNFKLYDCALTAEEVKTLYDMGRCDEGHHVVNFSKTRVGIGLGDGEAPRAALGVRGGATFRGGNVGINTSVVNESPLTLQCDLDGLRGLRIVRASGSGHWEITNQTFNDLVFTGTSGGYGVLNNVTNVGTIDFTGQHRNFVDGIPYGEYQTLEGLIVSANKNKYYDIDENITAGINAIQISQSLPLVALSNVANDKACFGVVAGTEDPETRKYDQGMFSTVIPKQKGDTRVYINSVGEGAIWVVNTNGSLESGDYITTSNVAGYGQKQNDDVLHNYTVAKITMDCDFNPATQPVQQILRSNVVETYYLGNVHKVKSVPHEFVTTTVGADDAWSNVSVSPSDVTYAEWSNLEANTQNTYTLTYTQTSNVVYDTKYTLTTTANVTESDPWDRVFVDPPTVTYAVYSNLEANTQNTYTLTFTQTTTDEKTPEEWSALESNVQSLYNKVYYQSVEEEVAATWPGAVAHTRVTDRIENELDEHGQIQWEDHPTETEKAYKVRYLTADGTQTDSANAVHIAAFVGCTYHCG